MRRRLPHQKLRLFLLGILVLYPIISLSTYSVLQREIFPFFWWELFSYIPPSTSVDYGLLIEKYEDFVLEQPVYFDEASELGFDSASIDAKITIQQLGSAIESQNELEANRLRQLLEAVHLKNPTRVEYQILVREFDIMKRWRCRCFIDETVIGAFEIHDASQSQ